MRLLWKYFKNSSAGRKASPAELFFCQKNCIPKTSGLWYNTIEKYKKPVAMMIFLFVPSIPATEKTQPV